MHRLFSVVLAGLLLMLVPVFPAAHAQEQAEDSLHGRVCEGGRHDLWGEAPRSTEDHEGQAADAEGHATDAEGHATAQGNATHSAPSPGIGCGRGLVASLVLRGEDGEHAVVSEHDGSYALDGLAAGSYELTASRAGFEDTVMDVEVAGKTWLDVPLSPTEVRVQVLVVDAQGRPVPEARTTLEPEAGGHGAEATGANATITLLAGHYFVTTKAPGHLDHWQPGVLVDGSGPIRVGLEPEPPRTALLTGRVADQDGRPVADAEVRVHQWLHKPTVEPVPYEMPGANGRTEIVVMRDMPVPGREQSEVAVTDADGRFELSLYEGEVSLSVHKQGHAGHDAWFSIAEGQRKEMDIELLRFPERDARLVVHVVDGEGRAVPHVDVDVRYPQYGIHECTARQDMHRPMPAYEKDVAPGIHDDGCRMKATDAGLEGLLMPGYAILGVHHDHWRACTETHDADGAYRRDCGPEYHGHVQVLDLAPDATTEVEVVLRARPGADATASGYVVDGATQRAIPGAHVAFSNQDGHGWGSAQTDGDGSYKIRLRGGYQHVHVRAEGYLPWEGVLEVPTEGDVPFDIVLTKGQERHGCCFAFDHAEPVMAAGGTSASVAPMAEKDMDEAARSEGGDDATYDDLGGGLGPYDPQAREDEQALTETDDVPGVAPVLLLAVLGVLACLARRRR